MENSPPPTRRRSTGLSLSDLPDIAIDEILSRLPIEDAVCTSILSRWWRRRWQSIPDLDLSELSSTDISQLLLLHSGAIRLFKLRDTEALEHWSMRVIFRYAPHENEDINRWLATLSAHSSSTLHTLFLGLADSLDVDAIARSFPNLTNLHLWRGSYVPFPTHFSGFACLRSLEVKETSCVDTFSTGLSRLISACPLLETLILLEMDSFTTSAGISLDIVAPNLRRLKLDSLQFDGDFTIAGAPMLQRASITSCWRYYGFSDDDDDADHGDNCNLMKVFPGLASAKRLKLDSTSLEFLLRGYIPERAHVRFYHLRILSLSVRYGDFKDLRIMLCLLKMIPNLEELKIKMYYVPTWFEPCPGFWKAQKHRGLFEKLETVMCKECKLGFIKFLLANAPALKTLIVDDGSRSESIMKKLLKFPRVSSQVQILFKRS